MIAAIVRVLLAIVRIFVRLRNIITLASISSAIRGLKLDVSRFFREKATKVAFINALNTSVSTLYRYFTFEKFIETFLGKEVLDKLRQTPQWDEMKKLGDKYVDGLKTLNYINVAIASNLSAINPEYGRLWMEHWMNIIWSIGIGWLSWVVLSPLLTTVIADKMNEVGNYAFRPRSLTPTQLATLLMRNEIDEETFKEELRRQGYPDDAIELLIKVRYRLLTLPKLQNALKYNLISEEEFKNELLKLGYHPQYVDLILQLTKVTKIEKEKDLTKSEILRLYRLKIIDRDKALTYLTRLGYDREEADLLLKIEDYQEANRIRHLSYSQIRRMYYRGIIDEAEVTNMLKELGYTDDAIKRILELWKVEKERTTIRVPISLIRLAYIYDVISKEKVIDMMKKMNYPDEIINVYVSVWDQQKTRVVKRLTPSQVINFFRYGLLPEEEAISELRKLGYTEEQAVLLLKYALIRPSPRRIRLTRTDILNALKKKVIDEETARYYLTLLGYHDDEIELLLKTYT